MNASGFTENAVGGQSHELYIPKNNIPYRAPYLEIVPMTPITPMTDNLLSTFPSVLSHIPPLAIFAL